LDQQDPTRRVQGRTVSRRELVRKGAIVGGAIWVSPVIQSIATPAYAQASPPRSTCCLCKQPPRQPQCHVDDFTCDKCIEFCADNGGVAAYMVGTACACLGRPKQCVPDPTVPNATCSRQGCG